MSICPVEISLAIWATVARPEEHCLLSVLTAAVLGMPAYKAAIRATVAPPPGGRTFPTATSSINEGLTPLRSMTPLKTAASRSSGHASLRPPFFALVSGVLTAAPVL